MISRAHRSPLVRLVVDRRPADGLARHGAAPDRLRALLRGEPAGRRAPRPRQPALRAPPRLLRAARARADDRAVLPDAAPGAPHRTDHARRLPRHDGGGALHRRGDQGLAALALRRRHVDPALGADEAGLHRHHRLALRRRKPAARRAGKDARRRAPPHHRGAARRRAGSRADDPLRRRLGRALLPGRREPADLRRSRRRRGGGAVSPPITSFRTSPGASIASSIRKAATISRS